MSRSANHAFAVSNSELATSWSLIDSKKPKDKKILEKKTKVKKTTLKKDLKKKKVKKGKK